MSTLKIVYSSLKEVRRHGTDSDFPAFPPSLGAVIRLSHFGGAVLETHTPKLSSLIEGESFECDMADLDTELRVRLLALASTCKSLAAELLEHAARLESQAKSRDSLIDNYEAETGSNPVPELVSSACKSHTRIVESSPEPKSRAKSPIQVPNLDLFD